MLDHPNHIENAKRALMNFDRSTTGTGAATRAVEVTSALRILLYEPADGYQGTNHCAHYSPDGLCCQLTVAHAGFHRHVHRTWEGR